MRPRSDVRVCMVEALRVSPAHPAELASRTGFCVDLVRQVTARMCRDAEALVVREQRVPGSNRPVKVYGLLDAAEPAGAARPAGHNWDLVKCWSAWPVDV